MQNIQSQKDNDILVHAHTLIEPDGDKLKINENTFCLIQKLKKFHIISIIGPSSSGKSHLLNTLMGDARNENGFQIGKKNCTQAKGIWAKAQLVPGKHDEYIVYLDTHGLGDVHQGDEDSVQILIAICNNLSVWLLLNILPLINMDTLAKYRTVTNMSQRIMEKSTDGIRIPKLYLILRDFELETTINGKKCSVLEYVKHCSTADNKSSILSIFGAEMQAIGLTYYRESEFKKQTRTILDTILEGGLVECTGLGRMENVHVIVNHFNEVGIPKATDSSIWLRRAFYDACNGTGQIIQGITDTSYMTWIAICICIYIVQYGFSLM